MTVSTVSSAEPPLEAFPYAGWIPTANGRLSFRHLGESRNPADAIYTNVTTDTRRLILVYQRRDLSDLLFQTIIHYLCNVEDRFWFAIAATSTGSPSDSDEIAGRVYIYKSKEDWRSKAQPVVRDSIEQLNDARLSFHSNRDPLIEHEFNRARTVLDATADIRADFLILRTGEVYLSNPVFSDSGLEYASVDYAESLRQDFRKWTLDQCYFFLRDIGHTHQHHAPSADTILILQERDAAGVRWRRNIIFSLHHYIIRIRRFGDVKPLYQASGILAYCSSFKKICERQLGDDAASQIPPFNEEALQQSLNARAGEQVQRLASLGTEAIIRLGRRTVGVAILAVAVAVLVMLIQPQIEKGEIPELTVAGNIVSEHLIGVVVLLIVFTAIMWGYTSDKLKAWQFSRDILEASNVRRRRAMLVFFGLAVCVFLLSVWAGYPAYRDIVEAFRALWNAFSLSSPR
jgi:hypothetical protein